MLSPLPMKCCLVVAALLPMRRIQTPKCAYVLVNGLQEMIKCHDTICNVWKSVCTKENLLSSTGRLCIQINHISTAGFLNRASLNWYKYTPYCCVFGFFFLFFFSSASRPLWYGRTLFHYIHSSCALPQTQHLPNVKLGTCSQQ